MLQEKSGCAGITVAKISEAVRLAEGGVKNIFITNEIVGEKKLRILAELVEKYPETVFQTSLDNQSNADHLARVLHSKKLKIEVFIEVNVGQNRCGVEPGEPVVNFLQYLIDNHSENLKFKGLLCYQGWNQHIRSESDRETAVSKVVDKVKASLKAIKNAGLPNPEIVSGGGTGSYLYEAGSGVFNEVQPGSYIFMDNDYNLNESSVFKQSLFLLTSVCSINVQENFLVVDAGWKSVAFDSGVPVFRDYKGVKYHWGGDEHGMMKAEPGTKFDASDFNLDQKLFLIPGHCDPTVNLHDELICVRNGVVEKIWKVDARGPGF